MHQNQFLKLPHCSTRKIVQLSLLNHFNRINIERDIKVWSWKRKWRKLHVNQLKCWFFSACEQYFYHVAETYRATWHRLTVHPHCSNLISMFWSYPRSEKYNPYMQSYRKQHSGPNGAVKISNGDCFIPIWVPLSISTATGRSNYPKALKLNKKSF